MKSDETMKEYQFDRYRLFYVSGPSEYRAKITVYNGSERVAMIMFTDYEILPENKLDEFPMKIYYSIKDFSNIRIILEKENPLSIYLYENLRTCEIGKRKLA